MRRIHDRMDQVIKGHPYAKATVDIACYDALGRTLGVPVSTLLGGRMRDRLEVAHSLGIMDLDRCLDEAEQAVAEGVGQSSAKPALMANAMWPSSPVCTSDAATR